MKKVLLLCALMLASNVWAQTVLMWDELRPKVDTFKDPFAELTSDQLYDLGRIARLDMKKELSQDEQDERITLEADLEKQGIDVEYLFGMRAAVSEQRRKMAMTPKQELDGGTYRVPGFITPIEFDNEKITQFFLVPTGGACVHTPPPPANQIILVDFPEGLKIRSMYEPVWVEGKMSVEATSNDVLYSDGEAAIDSAYTMKATLIEDYVAR